MQENANYIAWWMFSTFWGVSGRNKISVFILSPTVPKNSQSFEESHEEVRLLRTWKIFEKQLLNSTIVWCKELCWFRRLLLIHLGWSSSLIWTIIHIIPSFIRLRDQEELAEKWIASPLKLFWFGQEMEYQRGLSAGTVCCPVSGHFSLTL